MKSEYGQTCFLVPALDQVPARFGVVTACNPDGVTVSDNQNRAATEGLRSALTSAGFHIFSVTGCSHDLRHQEPGFGIVTNDRDMIVELGRQWRQEAVFWIEHDTVWLVPCGEGEAVSLGLWRALVHQPS